MNMILNIVYYPLSFKQDVSNCKVAPISEKKKLGVMKWLTMLVTDMSPIHDSTHGL